MFKCKASYFIIIVTTLVISSCKSDKDLNIFSKISGETMGTTYNISYKSGLNLKPSVDSILIAINQSVSTYIPSSTISKINNFSSNQGNEQINYVVATDSHYIKNFDASKIIYQETSNYFDPTVMPLVNYWGFGYTKKKAVTEIDSSEVSLILKSVGFDKWKMTVSEDQLRIDKPIDASLDFSGIAKGYAVDFLASFLESQSIQNYMVEIGGEVFAKGTNQKGMPWTIGLSRPEITAQFNDFQAIVHLQGKGMASSGNYRNYYEVDGKTYGHEINPKTGYPEINQLLGTTIIASECMTADAYATAFMVMGLEKSKKLVEKLQDVEACLFFRNEKGEIDSHNSSGFAQYYAD
ncbi:MAG: FAD:protein FMN transferase [Saprospiraceae bacterium]|nr:FAD:protein FMN transferase [Bacteroidia bacterium]NNE13817.1 FAD:protein FMN transferase [Saprospiraceae bacterium]NNL91101.1 FAD:protein FMN transferase [Saprospiraceae bacterium]